MKKTVVSSLLVASSMAMCLVTLDASAAERNVRSRYGRAITGEGDCVKSIAGSMSLCANDSDGDGVTDDRDECPGTPPNTKVDQRGCIAEINVPDVLFDFNKATLKPGFSELLTGLYQEYQGQVKPQVIIVTGHTDSIGSDAYNQRLSLARAQAVKQAMINMGIGSAIIQTVGMGESQPIADNETEEGRQRNRRVTIQVRR